MMILVSSANQDEQEAIAAAKHKYGDTKFSQDDFESAYYLYKEAYEIREGLFLQGADQLSKILSAFHAGKCLHILGHHGAAMKFYGIFTKSIFMSKNKHLLTAETAVALQQIGWAFYQDNAFKHARQFYDLALWSATRLYGETHESVARILNQFGTLCFDSGDMDFAVKYYERGLEIEILLQKSSNPTNAKVQDTLITLTNISRAYEKLGRFKKSLEALMKVIVILTLSSTQEDERPEKSSSRICDRLCYTLLRVAQLQRKMRRPHLALRTLSEILQLARQNSVLVATVLNEIDIINSTRKKHRTVLRAKN